MKTTQSKAEKKRSAPPTGLQQEWLREARRKGWMNFLGLYDQQTTMLRSTTSQTSALHLAVAGAPTSSFGLFAGEDQITGWPIFHDPIQGYREKIATSPNCVILGDVGAGKSSLAKTWIMMRNLMLGRRVVIVDKKMQTAGTEDSEHEGEYAAAARALGVEPIRFTGEESGLRINPLDPVITGAQHLTASHTDLLKAILEEVMGEPLTADERKAMRVARDAAVLRARGEGRVATIHDVTRYLVEPDKETVDKQLGHYGVEEYAQWGRRIGFSLEECIEGDLAGLIDGETSAEIRVNAGLTVFDISALPDSGPAVPVVMAIINTWLRSTLLKQKSAVPTFFVIEEGWHLVSGSFAKVSQQNTKKSRGLALSTVTNYQHLSDVPTDSPAIATIKEAGTVVMFRQARREDAEACQRLFGMPASSIDLMMNLEQGYCLMKVGSKPPMLMRASRSSIEAQVADTDGALLSQGRVELLGDAATPQEDEETVDGFVLATGAGGAA
ncbi:MAG: ATP-binding protein [Brachybacterium sp.]